MTEVIQTAAERVAAAIAERLAALEDLDCVERDRVSAVDHCEGVVAVVELDGETFNQLGGNVYSDSVQQSEVDLSVHLLAWSRTWQQDLDEVSRHCAVAIMQMRGGIDHLRLTRREWHARQTDREFGSVTLTFTFTTVCRSESLLGV